MVIHDCRMPLELQAYLCNRIAEFMSLLTKIRHLMYLQQIIDKISFFSGIKYLWTKKTCFGSVFLSKILSAHTYSPVIFVSYVRSNCSKTNIIQRNTFCFHTTSDFEVCETAQRFSEDWYELCYYISR